jgi:hypothetical protein
MATFTVVAVLLLTLIFYVLEIPHGMQFDSWRSITIAVLRSVFLPVMMYCAEIVKSLFPWPIIVIAAIAFLVWGPERVLSWLASVKFNIAGVIKFEGRGRAPELFEKEFGEAQKAVAKANKEIGEAHKSGAQYATELRQRFDIPDLVGKMAISIANAVGEKCPADFRLTLYVPDFIFEDRLYQFTEYYDKRGKVKTPGKTGRTYSIRYGIIGRVWRSGVTEIEGELISQEDRESLGSDPTEAEILRFIARRWGLTLIEAAKTKPYPSYGAIRIEVAGERLGLLFFDSKKSKAFGESKDLEKRIRVIVDDSPLTIKMLELHSEIGVRPRIKIFPKN